MGGRVGGAGEGVGEQGAGQHHHARSPRQGRLDGCDRNKALEIQPTFIEVRKLLVELMHIMMR